MAINDIVIILLFIVPGFVTLSVIGVLNGVKKRADFEFLYQSILISFLVNLAFLLFGNNIVSILKMEPNVRLAQTMHLAVWELLVAIIIGILIVCCTRWHILKGETIEARLFELFKLVKMTDRRDTGKVWESVCLGNQKKKEITILISDHLAAKGVLEYISDDPDLREITLESVIFMDAITGEIISHFPDDKKFYVDLGETLGLFYPYPQ